MIVSIEGCIASGKSTTATLVARRLGWPLILEDLTAVPYLRLFYESPREVALETELSFAVSHFHKQKAVGDNAVLDFTLAKDLLFAQMNLDSSEFRIFLDLYKNLRGLVPDPDLTVVLDAELTELRQRIARRGRDYELAIPDEYLNLLRGMYIQRKDSLGKRVVVVPVRSGTSETAIAEQVMDIVSLHRKD